MSWFSKNNKPEPEPQDNTPNKWHGRTFLSTAPPHRRLRSERCDCDEGQARGGCIRYENPDS